MGARLDRTTRNAKRVLPVALLAFLAFALYAGYGFGLAKHGRPAAPSITSSPPEVTNGRTPSFTFSDSDAIEKFECSLDGASFTDCGTTNPATKTAFGRLAAGLHTFQVRAVNSGKLSAATLYTWTIDLTAPTVRSIDRAGPSPTSAATVSWTVTFSEDVTGVDAGDFALARTGALTGGAVSSVTPLAGTGAFTVTSTTGTGDGSLRLDLGDDDSVKDHAGNPLAGSGAGDFSGQAYAIDKSSPATTHAPSRPPAAKPAPPGIDTTPPTVTVAFPADQGVYNGQSWASGCRGGAGICGSAVDPSGIATVELSIQRRSTARFWNGNAFNSTSELFGILTGGRYPLSLPPDGAYTIRVRATDNAGNTTPSTAYRTVSFRIKTTKPPKPVLDGTPADPTGFTTANFTWHDAASPVTYLCSVDNGSFSPNVPSQGRPYRPCATPLSYVVQRTNNGVHRFAVVAVDAAGNVSDATRDSWTVGASIRNFTISGDADGMLYPGGPARSIALKLANPNSVPITVTAVTVTPDYSALPAGCSSTAFTVTQSNVANRQVVIPANSFVTLPTGGTTAPTVRLADAGNQNRCKNAHVRFSYRGSAHS